MRSLLRIALSTAALVTVASAASAGSWVPVAPVSGASQTSPFGITDSNIVTGDYTDAQGVTHGFVGPIDGSNYKSFDDPDGSTQPRGINDRGWIAGFDSVSTATWERTPDGKLKSVKMDGTALDGVAQGLNKKGAFGADYIDPSTGATIGYLGKKAKYRTKSKLSIKNNGWALRGVDAAGDVAGWFYDPTTNLMHGYITVGGKTTQIDFPNATYTVMEGLNDKGIAPGQFEDSGGAIHGFYLDIKSGKMTQLDVSGATLTQIWGVNNNDVIAASSSAGSYVYCIHSRGCPKAPARYQPQHGSSRPLPQ
ncbi:MAG: hypothetical protein ACREHF_11935 [Rhizomicrobium sp.]